MTVFGLSLVLNCVRKLYLLSLSLSWLGMASKKGVPKGVPIIDESIVPTDVVKSVHAAGIEAGFRSKTRVIRAARKIVPTFYFNDIKRWIRSGEEDKITKMFNESGEGAKWRTQFENFAQAEVARNLEVPLR